VIDPKDFIDGLRLAGIDFATGVPDSLLKDICAYITNSFDKENHIISTNEGSALSFAAGYYLSRRKPALVYMQNSGLGNVINPITSLLHPQVYGIPAILLIGWRGEIDERTSIQLKDEPQHKKQGASTEELLKILDIEYKVINSSTKNIKSIIRESKEKTLKLQAPVAILVKKNCFSSYKLKENPQNYSLNREEIISNIVKIIPSNIPIVSTTGMASRELFEIRKKENISHERDFLTVGGMGHASQIAAGIAFSRPNSKVLCLDGDGALLMHTGSLAISADCNNLVHVLLNNEAHDSVGGQPTKGRFLKFSEIAKSFGYGTSITVLDSDQLRVAIDNAIESKKSTFIEVKCNKGNRLDLGRPDRTPKENMIDFMNFLNYE
tara:strand:- start:526 stop:1665 length:1140 start_codon:yes stop_codon:yes gene_type:complete